MAPLECPPCTLSWYYCIDCDMTALLLAAITIPCVCNELYPIGNPEPARMEKPLLCLAYISLSAPQQQQKKTGARKRGGACSSQVTAGSSAYSPLITEPEGVWCCFSSSRTIAQHQVIALLAAITLPCVSPPVNAS